MISEILQELKQNFGMKKNHLVILNLLSVESCTADEICERTTIPKGRVYNLLNELINAKLIDREKGVPAVYSMSNPESRVMDFLRHKFEEEVKKQTQLLSMLEQNSKTEHVEMISTNQAYDYELMGLLSQADWMKAMHGNLSISWFIQPHDEKEFWKQREEINKKRRAATTPSKDISILKFRAYMDFYEKKNVQQIMTKDAVDGYMDLLKEMYGKAKVGAWARGVISDLAKHKNVKLFVLDTPSSVFNMYITDKGVLSMLIFRGEISGMKIAGERVVQLYDKYFEELKLKAVPLETYLKAYE